jgi:hypothetical protein
MTKRQEYDKAYRVANREKQREQHREWYRKQDSVFHEKRLSQMRAHNLEGTGWTISAVETAKKVQEHRCAICSECVPLCADHEHTEPPNPRALLCHHCNTGLGMFKDNPVLLLAAAEYVRQHAKV